MPALSHRISERLLPLLQLTRMALVFTAIADSLCGLLLRAARVRQAVGGRVWDHLDPAQVGAMGVVSVGLYGFGMSLNDIIDRRRDRQLSPGRPLPSGRIGVVTAHVICFLLGAASLLAGAFYARRPVPGILTAGWPSLLLTAWTGVLIVFYDVAGKYLVWVGLLTLGLIRFFHAVVPAPELPLLWHPLFLLNHVALLSTVAYAWEEKRPPLNRLSLWGVAAGLFLVDAAAVLLVGWKRYPGRGESLGVPVNASGVARALWVHAGLLWPAAAGACFVALAAWVRRRAPTRREAGQKLMLYGLLWLIVYDAAFAAGYVGWKYALGLLAFLPAAWFSVQLMRWWSKLMLLSHRPQYVRAGQEEGRR